MTNEVIVFLKSVAKEEGFEVLDAMYGSIHIGEAETISQSSGAVYGIFVKSEAPPSPSLLEIPGHKNWYPVYWGKDMTPTSRIRAHVQGHKNGNINLPSIVELRGKPLIFGAILVPRYFELETILHRRFPPFKGRNSQGRTRTVSRIVD